MKLRAMRSGMTLIEVILAGSIAVLMTLALLEGIIVSTKISHENAQLLAAEGYAWETAWRWLSKASNDLNGSSTMMYYQDAAGVVIASNECPTICRELTGADAKCYVRVGVETNLARNGGKTSAQRIDVNVEWGPPSDRRCLTDAWPAGIGSRARSFNMPISVYKSSIDRSVKR